jgi:Secretory lipase
MTGGATMIRAKALVSVLAVCVLAVPGCGRPAPGGKVNFGAGDREVVGTVVARDKLQDIDPGLQSAAAVADRITYVSHSGIYDSVTHISGTVFVPRGNPPPGGWPIVAFGHPTTGTLPDCAPSLSPTLLGASTTVAELLDAGFVVSVPDYQGLGTLGANDRYHPYLDSTTVGKNLIDSVRATHTLVAATSGSWVALGISQGGQAAWAANELDADYGQGLRLLGSATLSPIADIDGLADAAAAGELTKDQELALQAYLAALKTEYPDVNLDDYRRGIVQDKWDVLSACQGPALEERATVADQITSDDLRPSSPAATETLRGFLRKTSLPQGPTQAPMLVIYGDHDGLIPREWTDRALDHGCNMGDVIQIEMQPGNGSADIDPSSAIGWLNERVNGAPVANSCGSFVSTYESTEENPGPR